VGKEGGGMSENEVPNIDALIDEHAKQRAARLAQEVERFKPHVPRWAHAFMYAEYAGYDSYIEVKIKYGDVRLTLDFEPTWFGKRVVYSWSYPMSSFGKKSHDLSEALAEATYHRNEWNKRFPKEEEGE
jgi:hypothetical protein